MTKSIVMLRNKPTKYTMDGITLVYSKTFWEKFRNGEVEEYCGKKSVKAFREQWIGECGEDSWKALLAQYMITDKLAKLENNGFCNFKLVAL